jgi:voltage-gated potassium channel
MPTRVRRERALIEFPGSKDSPFGKIGKRLLLALALITLIALVTYAGRDGYVDPEDDSVSLLDAFYYSTVSITTTGYGDVRPASDEARLMTTIVVTPARVLFLILLVGTTLEILAERSRHAYRVARWRKHLHDHTIVCGYGAKGRSAVRTMLDKGLDAERIVVIDPNSQSRTAATTDGLTAVEGSAAERATLAEAGIEHAASVVVAVDRDDTAVLITLTARELNAGAVIVGSVREEENVHLLEQSGANGVITSSSAAGRLLGLSSETPEVATVLEDIFTLGQGLDVIEREVAPDEAGPHSLPQHESMLLAIVRDGKVLRFGDAYPETAELQPGDRVLELKTHRH